MQHKTYPCTGCGCCCKVIDQILANAHQLLPEVAMAFPYKHNNGVCEMLVDNKCSVYDNRPLLCRVDDLQKHLHIPIPIFYELTRQSCNTLIDKFGIDESFKVKL